MCYKPSMRKWMRDKLKRRKKTESEAAAQPAPLQPAYFEPQPESATANEPRSPEPPAEAARESQNLDAEQAADAGRQEGSEKTPRSRSAGAERRPRRRRGRGGRGRRRSGPAATPVSADSSAVETEGTGPGESAPVPVASAAPVASSKGTVVLAIGLPGSGKSSWFKRNNISPLSSDMIRAMLFDDPNEQRFQDLVFSNLRSMLRARLIARRPMNYLDATNLTPHDRGSWIKLAKDSGYEVQALYFDVPLEVCLERNQKRQRVVQEEAMRRMSAKLKPPTFEEGFSKITVVRVKQKE